MSKKPESKEPKKKTTISKADELIKGAKSAELDEEELKRVAGGIKYIKTGS